MDRICFTLLLLTAFLLPITAQKNLLHKLMKARPAAFQTLLDHPEQYDIQIIYTQIDRDEHNFPHFKQHSFQLDKNLYYYPASTVKMPTAFLALEKLNQLKIIGLDKNSVMKNGAASPPQTAAETDSTAENGLPSLAHYVKKIFLVSDNDANNRLYEFLGQQAINERLWAKGYEDLRIVHRLGVGGYDAEANRHTNPVGFYEGEKMLYYQGEVDSRADKDFNLKKTLRGKGFYEGDSLVNRPFDFSEKNYVSLQCFHDMLQAVMFPEAVPPAHRFDLTEDDYRLLYQVMSERPRESLYPKYDHEADQHCKFFIYGDRKEDERMPPNVRIFNKVGWAYGFLTDVSYIVDFDAGVEFFLAATIHVNADGVYNDDNYEYESVGLPFFSNLGQVVYDFEKKRKRKHKPDLRKFVVESYD
ncbi:MAG: class A beta-lactamase-related serine hydrolase [Saprospiraceae bacterium]|nr:class A beta-lactamase-related serine hydrolase [Saprospiraceae bacterium]MCF8252249.1 class A beta-lactamase-related serine hydrolase [Saprospiraceae bacterium]MCF8282344.1 class A beta-lactamase-related serine hydrolase [Bacteroidales bacterium]MCF8313871.1 class A beta-lactamase-related serine hydrolase [Saprospiraceae bacterium]MCF8442890.1 class A beta-lactamase-related serine hydrolase [Saprospiraceae bacterium]